jgi:hypothetical protein
MIRFHTTLAVPTTLYGSETWVPGRDTKISYITMDKILNDMRQELNIFETKDVFNFYRLERTSKQNAVSQNKILHTHNYHILR